jgi:hypothetical protein
MNMSRYTRYGRASKSEGLVRVVITKEDGIGSLPSQIAY